MRRVHQQWHTSVHGCEHGLRADRVDHDQDAGLLALVDDRSKVFQLRGRRRLRVDVFLADEFDPERGEPAQLRACLLRGPLAQIDLRGGNDTRPLELARIDSPFELEVSFGRAAASEQRRVSGLEELLHALCGLILQPLIRVAADDVTMSVDEAGHQRHAARVDRPRVRWARRSRADRRDAATPDDHGAGLDDRAVAHQDAGVGNDKVLGGQIRRGHETTKTRQAGKGSERFHGERIRQSVRRTEDCRRSGV